MHVDKGRLAAASILLMMLASGCTQRPTERPPNLVIILADDLGYGDLACYGHPTIRTPHLDQMAREGMRFTDFYAASQVCTPSRAALLTGRYPVRSGMASDKRRVLFPNSSGGLPHSEITIAEALKTKGYATACVGKWHLGHLPQHLPANHGFDHYFGLPYSNDMNFVPGSPRGPAADAEPKLDWFRPPLIRDGKVIERPAHQPTLTRRYTDEAIQFMRQNKQRPFFLYLAHTMPHVPLFASDQFKGKSPRGLYGDVVEELDANVGRILAFLQREQLDQNTLVIFTSDNGPWLTRGLVGGSAGLLRDGKGSTFEGGQRVPTIARWPGTIKPNQTCRAMACNMDLFNTALALADIDPPTDRPIDGVNLLPLLKGQSTQSPRDTFIFYRDEQLFAVRKGPWKAHYSTKAAYGDPAVTNHNPPLLFNLAHDPSEQHDVAARHPKMLAELARATEQHRQTVTPMPNQVDPIIGQRASSSPTSRPPLNPGSAAARPQ